MMPLQLLTSQRRMSRAGFTLLDIILVISFVSLLAAITFPRIVDVQERFALRGAVMAFMSTHSMARSTAIRQGGVAELHVDPTNDLFWVEVDTTLGGTGVMDTIGFVVDLGDHRVTLSSTQTVLCFDGRGLASSASGCATTGATIVFNSVSGVDTILTTALGKILR